jgi:ubiquinone/menaquinone biosynthesis C-methylase UbiE
MLKTGSASCCTPTGLTASFREPAASGLTADADNRWQDWRDLDSAADPGTALAFLDAIAAVPAIASAKQRSFELVGARPGHRVLDAGCGTGTDLLALAELVRPGGEAVGVDSSELALAEGRRKAGDRADLRFVAANLAKLPFPDGSFDGARADRAIQHLARPELAVAELARVTRPGGAVVITEATFKPGGRGHNARSVNERSRGTLLAFIPYLMRRSGIEHVVVERFEGAADANPEVLAMLGARAGPLALSVVHIAGTVRE